MASDSQNNKETLSMMYFALIFAAMFQLCFANSVQVNMKTTHANSPNQSGSHFIFPVQGDVYPHGVFHASVLMGNPPKLYFLDIDTGSNLTWVQCAVGPKPVLFKGPHPPYKPKGEGNGNVIICKDPLCAFPELCKSPNDQCDFEVEYADRGSSLGVMLKDPILLKFSDGTEYRSPLAFGCGYDQEMSPPYNVDGILGLSNGKSSIVSQLSSAGFKNAHGHCFSRHGGGFLFIGDHAVPSGTVWTAMLPNQENHYLLGPSDLFVGNAAAAKGLTVVFDSGSTYTYLNAKTYQATLSLVNTKLKGTQLSQVKDNNLPICWKGKLPFTSIDEVESYFSPLVLSFTNNARFLLPPEAYLIISSHGNVCLGILNGTEAKLGDLNIIGAISFQDKLLIYDNENRKIGWAPLDCK